MSRCHLPEVSTIDPPPSPVAAQALSLVNSTSRAHQLNGWWFNKVYQETLVRDAANKVPVAANATNVVAYKWNEVFTIRDGFLYDMEEDTDIFTKDPIVTTTYFLEWDSCPPVFQEYVALEAALQLHQSIRGQSPSGGTLNQERSRAWANLKSQDSRARIRSTYSNPHSWRMLRTWR